MEHDEHELLVEYSEMTAFNFDSKEYKEIRKDFLNCREKIDNAQSFFVNLVNFFSRKQFN